MKTIHLTEEQVALAYDVARKRAAKLNSFKFTKSYIEFVPHLLGIAGEIAYGSYIGEEPDYELYQGGDLGYDFILEDGTRVEVKARNMDRYNKPDLLVRPEKAKADMYVLTWVSPGDISEVTLVGWCWHDELVQQTKSFRDGRPARYFVEVEKLREIR